MLLSIAILSSLKEFRMISDQYKDAVAKIDSLDLKMIKMKLCESTEKGGKGWSVEQSEECEVWYRRFLKLRLVCGKRILVPTKMIDDMWHYHILDTFKYHEDCQNIFGKYIHHFPYFGLRGKKDAQDQQRAFHETMDLFEKYFGEKPYNPTIVHHKVNRDETGGGMKCG